VIQVQNLSKAFGPKYAVSDLSFTVERGEVLGFLGPNGAGKSTTMRMVTGFIPPTAGTITVGGFDVVEDPLPAKRLLGYLPENAPGYADMTVQGFLRFIAELRGYKGTARRDAVNRAIELCFLENVLHQSIDTLSKGYKHRTCLAQALLHDPDVLILDEPTDGLDPNQKHEVRGLIKRMGENKAIVFSTHILEEVEAVCSRVIIIDRGRIVANGTPEELKARSDLAGAVQVRATGVTATVLAEQMKNAPGAAATQILVETAGHVVVRVFPDKSKRGVSLTQSVTEVAARNQWKIEEMHTEEGRLDEVFRAITLPDTVRAREGMQP
jgi:ABC-2 type transport system ATP-binding protein